MSATIAVGVLDDGVWLGQEGHCGQDIRIWLFVDIEYGGMCCEG